jgi:hypothetical protein
LRGKTILVWSEQGIGDHVLHAHQARALQAAGARVVLETDPRLVAVFARSLPGVACVGASTPPAPAALTADIDYEVPLLSLPLYMPGWPQGAFPVARWLAPDPHRKADIAARLAARAAGRPIIGIAWRSQRPRIGPAKSTDLGDWGPILAGRDALFVTLQYGDTQAEVAAARAATGADIYTDPEIDRFNDLDGLAALVDCLDLVVTTSNATVHLAGALGKPTLLAVHHLPIWYWFPAFDAYRSVERFTQQTPLDWAPVISAIAGRLGELLAR